MKGNIKKVDIMSRFYINMLKELLEIQKIFFTTTKSINFNKSKFHQLFLS